MLASLLKCLVCIGFVNFVVARVVQQIHNGVPCILTGDETTIQSILDKEGEGAVVNLCPNAHINLKHWITFNAAHQEIRTLGYPNDHTRAVLNVSGEQQACAVVGNCGECNYIQINNIIILGNRDKLGMVGGGAALVEIGGDTTGQQVKNSKLAEPRGWSALHYIEGTHLACRNATIYNNDIGPCGNSPTGHRQFRRSHIEVDSAYAEWTKAFTADNMTKSYASTVGYRNKISEMDHRLSKRKSITSDEAVPNNTLRPEYTPGQWADGISLACKTSFVANNRIIDPTDAGIVIFQAAGSLMYNNTIYTESRQALAGISMTDYYPFSGNYTDVRVIGNKFVTNGTSLQKIGIAVGTNVWAGHNASHEASLYAQETAIIAHNSFISLWQGSFGYGIAASGFQNLNITGNDFDKAVFNASASPACHDEWSAKPGPIAIDRWTTSGAFQAGSMLYDGLIFLICVAHPLFEHAKEFRNHVATVVPLFGR